MIIKITNGEMSEAEQQAYLKMGVEKYPNNKINKNKFMNELRLLC